MKKKYSEHRSLIGITLSTVQLFLSVGFLWVAYQLNVFPLPYFIAIAVALGLVWLLVLISQALPHVHRFNRIAGQLLTIIVCVALLIGTNIIELGVKTVEEVTSNEFKTDRISIITLADTSDEMLQGIIAEPLGMLRFLDRPNTDNTVSQIQQANEEQVIELVEYLDVFALVDALYNREVKYIIFNEAFRGMINDLEVRPLFDQETKVVYQTFKETSLIVDERPELLVSADTFTVYLAGVDTFGPINTKGRSDVNIVATINPLTKQVLLTSVPRDYYVPLACSYGIPDKLTHAGLYGVDCSMDTLEEVLDVDIDFYVRANFSSVVDIVNHIGGIDVNSKYNFTTIYDARTGGSHTFSAGINHVNGFEALAFVRERKNLPNGDLDRGVHQMETLKALANKAPSLLANYKSVLNTISSSFETNMNQDQMAELVRMQLKDMASWNIVSQYPDGYFGMQPTYSGGAQPLSVLIPDEASLSTVRAKIQSVFDGAILTP